jgi:hypothetical protein
LRNKTPARANLTDYQRASLIAFLRDWLPEEAKQVYRDMIRAAPDSWWQDPHFDGGIILEYALRGNGFNEKALGVKNLEPLWPDLLAHAVAEESVKRKDADRA